MLKVVGGKVNRKTVSVGMPDSGTVVRVHVGITLTRFMRIRESAFPKVSLHEAIQSINIYLIGKAGKIPRLVVFPQLTLWKGTDGMLKHL